jgi:hypothetical protein
VRALEPSKGVALPEDVKEKLEELRALSKKAEAGDKGARRELKQALLESSPAVIARAADVGRRAQHMLIEAVANDDPLTEYALRGRLDLMRTEVAGGNLTPLEVLLTERIAAAWMLLQILEVFSSAQLGSRLPKEARASASITKFYLDWQEQAHRQLLTSIKALAQVRKLQSNTPSLQFNTQINLGKGRTEAPR